MTLAKASQSRGFFMFKSL
ncbi:hypothetical protein CU052_14805 [Vibrio harveyi]|uniref:Neuromedin U C-terminal domain-containing protein n=1 Tax=Vibrio harveyi TaxID=669 RepID=A0A8B3DEV3_VIBHA|nr:hypothetical protein CU052_14805 [Vibrio harveyi]QFQ79259.1 hypothetical protein F9277_08285 [Vibrio harveyi]RCR61427.1 hypothetical protein DTW68_18620 [Vibrio harveyi]RIW11749.1 hypothetical protein DS957_014600 [Vibrio harveyi]